jgi:hypothetical protein
LLVELQIEGRTVRIAEQRPPERSAPRKRKDADKDKEKPSTDNKDRNLPQVFILSSGDITPFELHLRPALGKPGISLAVAENGTVKQVRDDT